MNQQENLICFKCQKISWKAYIKKQILLFSILLVFTIPGCKNSDTFVADKNSPAHHAKEGFRNPYLQGKKRGFFSYLKMRYFSDEKFAENKGVQEKIPTIPANLELIQNPLEFPQITWIGHATVLIQYNEVNILTDPIFSDRASPFSFAGPKRFNEPALTIENLPAINYVLISHNHYDHLDLASIKHIGNKSKWLVPLNNASVLKKAGIKPENIIEFDWWDEQKFPKLKVTATPGQHWSSRGLWDRNEMLWSSWLIQYEDFTVWYSGDTGYNPYQFKEIGSTYKNIDLSLIAIGAYAPRWFMKDMHINPEEAVKIHQDVGSKYSIGIQWGTFELTAEPLEEPPIKLKEALEKKNIPLNKFETIKIGETKIIS